MYLWQGSGGVMYKRSKIEPPLKMLIIDPRCKLYVARIEGKHSGS